MYACIHCDFDNTLTVLGKQSKKLKLLGEFKVKEKVELKWSKSEIYTGIIVKINGKLLAIFNIEGILISIQQFCFKS